MLRIGYIVICEDVIREPEQGRLHIRNPMPALTPLSLPGNFSFKVAFSLHNIIESDRGKVNNLRIVFKDPNGKVIIDTQELKMIQDDDRKHAIIEVAEVDLSMNNIELYETGLYTLILNVNGETKELEIPVLERSNKHE